MTSQVKDFNELPVMLKADDVAAVMGISRATAFTLVKDPSFPSIRVGPKRIVIPRDKFLSWLEEQADKPLECYK